MKDGKVMIAQIYLSFFSDAHKKARLLPESTARKNLVFERLGLAKESLSIVERSI